MEHTYYSYEEAVRILESENTLARYFYEEKKNIHVCLAYNGKIRWAWGSQSFYKDIECFSDKQVEYMKNARFRKEYSGW